MDDKAHSKPVDSDLRDRPVQSLGFEEAELERAENARCEARQILQRCKNRLVLDGLDIAERYANDELCIYIEVAADIGGLKNYGLLIQSIDGLGGAESQRLCCVGFENRLDAVLSEHASGCHQINVFVAPIEVVKCPKEVITSFVRLQLLDDIQPGPERSLYFSLCGGGFKHIFGAPEGEIDSGSRGYPVLAGHADSQQIQRRPEVMNGIGGHKSDHRIQFMDASSLYKSLGFIRIEINDKDIRLTPQIGLDRVLHIKDVAIGPFDL